MPQAAHLWSLQWPKEGGDKKTGSVLRRDACMGSQVINEYKKARVLMADSAATNKSGVWQSLFHEVEKVSALSLPH